MATSGNYTLTTTALDIVKSALRKCQAVDADQPFEVGDLNTGLNELNRLVKYLQTRGANLWKETEGILFLDVSKQNYLLGPTGDECCDADDFVNTTTDAAEVTSQTVISVTSTTGFANSDVIGIELDDGTRHWSTISSFVANDTVTIATGLASAAASGNSVYVFTSLIPRPLAVIGEMSRFQSTVSGEQIPIRRWSREEYFNQPDKSSTGDVVNDYYQPLTTNGKYYVWQPSSTVNGLVRFTYQKPIEVFSTSADNPDFPDEWMLPLTFKLAEILAPEYSPPPDVFATVKQLAVEYMEEVFGFDEDMAPLQIVVEE